MPGQIESCGQRQTTAERETDAVRAIIHALARIEAQVYVLGHHAAAEHCREAIKELRQES